MMRLALLVELIAAIAATAAPPTIAIPPEVKPVGEYASFIPSGDAVSVYYVGLSGVSPVPSGMLRDSRAFLLSVRGLPAGRYQFVAVAASKEGEQLAVAFSVAVGDGPAPGPTPPNPPPPPPNPPADPLADTLRSLYGADQSRTKKDDCLQLAAVYKLAVDVTDDTSLTTAGDLFGKVAAAGRLAVPLPRLQPIREAIANELTKQLGDDAGAKLDATARGKAKAQFSRMARLLEELAK